MFIGDAIGPSVLDGGSVNIDIVIAIIFIVAVIVSLFLIIRDQIKKM